MKTINNLLLELRQLNSPASKEDALMRQPLMQRIEAELNRMRVALHGLKLQIDNDATIDTWAVADYELTKHQLLTAEQELAKIL